MTAEDRESAAQHRRAIARLASFGGLDAAEIDHLAGMAGPPRQLKRGALIRGGEEDDATSLVFLIDGWAASAIILGDGCRQLAMVSLPGDMLGLPALAVREPIDAVVALSAVIVCDVGVEQIAQLFEQYPRLAALLFLVSQEERVFAMERLALLGQAKARNRLAALFLRLAERISLLEGEDVDRFPMPLTQQDIGDLIGVSAVHTNALLRQMREAGLAHVEARALHIPDRQALAQAAGVYRWKRATPSWLPRNTQLG